MEKGSGDFQKPTIAVASAHSITPDNSGMEFLARAAESGITEAGGTARTFDNIISSLGDTEQIKFSLVRRKAIADSFESVCRSKSVDGLLAIGGCDDNMSGAMLAIARLNIPSSFVFGGTTGELATTNSMSAAIEALGMSLPGSSTTTAVNPESDKYESTLEAGRLLPELIKNNIRPRDILTQKAFENAITVVMASGGSTNTILHLLAIANAAQVPLELNGFETIARRTPPLIDMKPSGKYLAADLHEAGGIPRLMKQLLEAGRLHGDCMTVTGKTLAENLQNISPEISEDQDLFHPIEKPLDKRGHLVVLRGNIAPGGAVAQISGLKTPAFTGMAKCYDSEADCVKAIQNNEVEAGDVLIIRYVGPVGGPGMHEMQGPMAALLEKGLGDEQVCLVTDGRLSNETQNLVVAHVSPEAAVGGPIAMIRDDDLITVDAFSNLVQVQTTLMELDYRARDWKPLPTRHEPGIMAQFAKLAGQAEFGVLTDEESD